MWRQIPAASYFFDIISPASAQIYLYIRNTCYSSVQIKIYSESFYLSIIQDKFLMETKWFLKLQKIIILYIKVLFLVKKNPYFSLISICKEHT